MGGVRDLMDFRAVRQTCRMSGHAHGTPAGAADAEQLALLVAALAEYAVFLLDREGHVTSWNRGAERLNGYAQDEIVGQHFSRFYTDEDRRRGHPDEELAIALREGSYREEGWRVRRDGTPFWADVLITAVRDEDGRHVGFGKVTRDLTERWMAEQQLRATADQLAWANAQLEQFRLLVSRVQDYAIFLLDPDGRVRSWNPGAQRIKGYTEAEAVGRHFGEFWTPEDRARDLPARALEAARRDGRHEEEAWRVRKDGTRFWASVLLTALEDDAGTFVGYAKITRDLSERRAAEEALRTANAELERFASAAAHDLVEPLRTMSGLADLLRMHQGERLDDEGRLWLGEIRSAAERGHVLVDALLEYARASQRDLELGSVAVADILDEVLVALRGPLEERGGTVEAELPDDAAVLADGGLLRSVLQNLLSNAIKFGADAPHVRVTAERDGDAWLVAVTDDGIGIAPEHIERVFGLFERLNPAGEYPGTGLGLALALRLVTRMGGRLGVESTPGSGSRFWLTLGAAS
jgi:PAS domain S-box-containing protein